jgi:hypothetical protein
MNQLSIEDQRCLDALSDAVAKALERKRRLGQYAVVWQEGQPVGVDGEAEKQSKGPATGSEPPARE